MIYRNLLSMLIIMAPNANAAASSAGEGDDAPQAQAQAQAALRFASIEIKKDHLQQQRDDSRKLRSLEKRTRARKENKPDPFCEKLEQVLACGQTFTNKVVLSDDLVCNDDVADASDQVLGTLNAGITLVGPGASLDCKGHTVRQVSWQPASECDVRPRPGFDACLDPFCSRVEMKKDCDLYYQVGIMLKDGATAKNCKAEQFYQGILVMNGGRVEDSEATGNNEGIFVLDEVGSKGEVSKVNARFNQVGVSVLSLGTGAEVSIEKATGENNLEYGMRLRGSTIFVKDSTASSNMDVGIKIAGELKGNPTKVHFSGKSSSFKNSHVGILADRGRSSKTDKGDYTYAGVTVEGELETYQNRIYGLAIYESMEMPSGFVVEDKGSFTACQNGDEDIKNFSHDVDFVDENSDGDGFMCDTGCSPTDDGCGGSIDQGDDVCVPCPTCGQTESPTFADTTNPPPS